MKKGKAIQTPRISGENANTGGLSGPRRKLFIFLFFLILLSSVALKIYKADRAGISYDESLTFQRYCDSVHTALTSFDPADASSTNNHLLNSIFIHYAHKYLNFYEHFIRIPSLSAGIMFSLALAYIIYKTIQSPAVRLASLALVSLVPFVFDYSYLARGYAFALAGIYTEIAFVLWLLEHRIRQRWWPIPVVVISLMNFLAFGSMMSSMLMLAAFNLTFILLYSPRIFRDTSNKLKPIILSFVSIFVLTSTWLFFLYRGIYKEILGGRAISKINKGWKGWSSFLDYLHNLLVNKVFRPSDSIGMVILYAVVLLLVVAIAFHIYKFRKAIKAGLWREYLRLDGPASFILIFTGLTIMILFVYSVILNRSPGLPRRPRSQLFLIPLALTAGAIILDRFVYALREKKIGRVLSATVIIVLILVTLRNLPSPYRMGGSTLSGPVLRKLRAIDPDKTWNIAFSEKMRLFYMGFLYYQQFDYKFNIIRGGKYDVLICRKTERPARAVCLNWTPFSDSNCDVIINCQLPADRVVLEAWLIKD